jgi:hypothetical protein
VRTLSKSDFKLGHSCATKIYYREYGYPERSDDDPFLKFLAEGGYMVEQLAKMLYDGTALEYGRDAERNWSETLALLGREDVTLFEATLLSGRKLARVDILQRHGNRFDLIEVKSKSLRNGEQDSDSEDDANDATEQLINTKGAIYSNWREYVEDVAYQVEVLRELFPDAEIVPHLLVVNKSQACEVDRLPALFRIERDVVDEDGVTRDLIVEYRGGRDAVDPGHFLALRDVSKEVAIVAEEVRETAAQLVALYHGDEVTRAEPRLSWRCGGCEFRVRADEQPNGFLECWGEGGRVRPHLLDLWNGGHVARRKPVIQELIDAGRTSLFDIPVDILGEPKADGTGHAHRQIKQIEHQRSGDPYRDARLGEALARVTWPIHFIDFETLAMAVPPFKEMRPYEKAAFQWSCHTIATRGAAPVHSEWLAPMDEWPSGDFARTLRGAIGEHGTVMTWSSFERTTLTAVRAQSGRCGALSGDLEEWLDGLIVADDDTRLFDLEKLCRKFYLHPLAHGRTSIKPLLDGLWQTDPRVRAWYDEWSTRPVIVPPGQGPYEALPARHAAGEVVSVHDGTGAMNAYRRLLFEDGLLPEVRVALRDQLLAYCELDTLAMVLVWRSWL